MSRARSRDPEVWFAAEAYADLPSPGISRWVTRRKAEVVAAVQGGLLTRESACERYNLTDEEFEGWERLYARHGAKGLRTTRLQQYRR